MASDDGKPLTYPNDGKWPQSPDDPEWQEMIEMMGGLDRSMAAAIAEGVRDKDGQLMGPFFTTEESIERRLAKREK